MIPGISVIVPTRNREDTIGRAVRSVLQSKRADIEIVVVDDGSTDATRARLTEIDDPRLVVQWLDSPGNANRARNTGAAVARGPVLAFLDSDDAYGPGRIDRLLTFFTDRPDVDCLIGGYVDISPRRSRVQRLPRTNPGREALRRMLVAHLLPLTNSAIAVRRRAFEAVGGYDEAMRRHQDRELLLRLSTSHSISFGAETDIEKHRAADSMSHDLDGYIAGLDALVARHGDYRSPQNIRIFRYLIVRGILKAVTTGQWGAAAREISQWRAARHLPKDYLRCLLAYPAGRRERFRARDATMADPIAEPGIRRAACT
jgi:glycosyltransferase involved in cell wall biosynthesis